MDLFKLEPGLAVWTWIVFGLLLFILWKYLIPSLMKGVKDREKLISDAVDNAAKIEARLAEIEEEHAEIMKRTKEQADEILRKTREEAEVVRKRLLEKADEEARQVVELAKERMAEERAAMLEALRLELADFICDSSEKLIGRSFVSEKDREWTKELARTL